MAEFRFKQFSIDDRGCGMKICSDSVLLGAWFLPAVAGAGRIADAGTGSGVLSLMAAQCCPQAHVFAVELDKQAITAAISNFKASPWSERITAVSGDFTTASLPTDLDAIISNPPYFACGALSPDDARAAARHQASLSFGSLIARSVNLLAADGHLGLISPAESENEIIFASELAGLKINRLCRVASSPRRPVRRLLWDISRDNSTYSENRLDLREADGTLSVEYRRIVDPFYIKIS